MLTFYFSGAEGHMTGQEVLTAGMVGRQILLEFSPEWESLSKTVVFSDGVNSRDVVFDGSPVTIPAKVLEKPLRRLTVGVFGIGPTGAVVIPTVRVEGPVILPGTILSEEMEGEEAAPVWTQILGKIGDLSKLITRNKQTLVAAINEVKGQGGGGSGLYYIPSVSEDGVLKWTNNGSAPNPMPVNIRGPAGADGYSPVRGTDYWTEADKAEIRSYVEEAILGGAW
jgi:hypothetical protein